MRRIFRNFIGSQTGRDTTVVFIGTFVNVTTGGLFFILAPRLLGPSNYGLFAVVTSTGVLIANLANFGIDTGILRFANFIDQNSANRILKLAFQAYLLIGVSVFVIGFVVSNFLANLLGHPSLAPLLKIAFSATIFLLLTDFFIATLQAKKQFLKASIVNISSNLLRILILILAAYYFITSLYFLTFLFFFIPIVSVFFGKIFVPLDFLKAKTSVNQFKNFFSYNFWIAASIAVSSVPIDNYLLLKLAGPIATGLYAAPYKILSSVDQFAGNFSRVLAPRLTSFDNHRKAKEFAKETAIIVLAVCMLILIAVISAGPIVNLLLGSKYLDSVNIFRIIGLSEIFFFGNTIPVSLIIYYFGKPKVTLVITVIVTAIWILSNILLIPTYKTIGAAIAELILGITSFSLFTLYVLWQFSLKKNNEST